MSTLRNYFDRGSIRTQLSLLLLMASSTVLAISMTGVILLEWENQQMQAAQALESIAQATSIAASAAVAFHDRKAAGEALRIVGTRPEIEGATLYSAEGVVLASYGRNAPDRVNQLSLPSLGLFSTSTTLFQPIQIDGSTIGHIFLRANLRVYRNHFLQQAALATGINLLGLLLVLAVGLGILDRLIKPVKDLAQTARKVRANKNFSLRAASPLSANEAHNEVGDLIISFNAMLAEIERRDLELALYQRGLERRVEARTADLNEANRELQSAKEHAEASNLAKSRFLAAAGHDLRQPIHAMSLYGAALSGMHLTEPQKQLCHQLSLSTQSLGDILEVLLDISQMDAGKVKPCLTSIRLDELLHEVHESLHLSANMKSLRFPIHVPPLWVYSDAKLLKRLIANLIGNAIKYTQQGGVLVGVRLRGHHAVVQIWDTGEGIAPRHIRAIFDEYFQVGNAERDRTKGLGLGLAISRRLAELLGTEVVCRSRLGKGSVFEVSLEIADSASTPEVPADSPSKLAQRHVVVIDDDRVVIMATRLALESFGMRVTCHHDAEEALASPDILDADFYLSDLSLPGLNGIQLLAAIEQRSQKPIQALLLTGDTSMNPMLQTARWKVLIKPVKLATLLAAIGSAPAGEA